MGTAESTHPSDQQLRSFGLGTLDPRLTEIVGRHLDSCSTCRNRVSEVSSDSFLVKLRNAQVDRQAAAHKEASLDGLSATSSAPLAVSPSPATTLPPDLAQHPDYEILGELGRGGMGVVYLAQNKLMGRKEVLKVINRDLIDRPGVLERFLREIRNAARLHHANIVTAFAALRVGESVVFAMEYVEGFDLAKLVKSKGPLSVAHASNFIYQAALGLQHAHERGMIHRDIKPSNLMLSKEGKKPVIKILDFGLAKATQEAPIEGGLTREGQMLGTPDYLAPEQSLNAHKADIRADIYSLGCTLYFLLNGKPPFPGTSLYEILQAHHSMDAPALNLLRPDVPMELAMIVARMMAKEPDRRFQEPREVAQALKPVFTGSGQGVVSAKPEMSMADESAGKIQRTQTAKPSGTANPVYEQATLVNVGYPEALLAKTRTRSETQTGRRLAWLWPSAAAGILVFGLIAAWGAGVLRVKTPNGFIVIENVPSDAVVEVDGERITVNAAGSEPIRIEARAGKHGVIVKRGKDLITGESVMVEAGKEFTLAVRIDVPPATIAPARKPSSRTPVVSAAAKAVWNKLEAKIAMPFANETPLDDVLRHINKEITTATGSGIPIYVDPNGLQSAEKTPTSPIQINVTGKALRTTLELALAQLSLVYYVHEDGLLIITDKQQDLAGESSAWPITALDNLPSTKETVAKLNLPISMPFANETPLDDVLKYISAATKSNNDPGIQTYLDPNDLQEAQKTPTSPVQMDLEGVPLRTTLRLLLRQLGLDCRVQDGLLKIGLPDKIEAFDTSAKTRAVLARLKQPMAIHFPDKTPLKQVLSFIAQSTTERDEAGIPIDLAPNNGKLAQSANSSLVTLDLDGAPLSTTLPKLLAQVELSYYVKDGRIIIDEPDAVEKQRTNQEQPNGLGGMAQP